MWRTALILINDRDAILFIICFFFGLLLGLKLQLAYYWPMRNTICETTSGHGRFLHRFCWFYYVSVIYIENILTRFGQVKNPSVWSSNCDNTHSIQTMSTEVGIKSIQFLLFSLIFCSFFADRNKIRKTISNVWFTVILWFFLLWHMFLFR